MPNRTTIEYLTDAEDPIQMGDAYVVPRKDDTVGIDGRFYRVDNVQWSLDLLNSNTHIRVVLVAVRR